MLGKEIAVLVNEEQSGGAYTITFSTPKHKLSSGIYFYKLPAGTYSKVVK